jgi:hypothetical protein
MFDTWTHRDAKFLATTMDGPTGRRYHLTIEYLPKRGWNGWHGAPMPCSWQFKAAWRDRRGLPWNVPKRPCVTLTGRCDPPESGAPPIGSPSQLNPSIKAAIRARWVYHHHSRRFG